MRSTLIDLLSPTTAARRQERRAVRRDRAALAADMAAFETQADITELAALLERYDDETAAPLRDLVDWTRAA